MALVVLGLVVLAPVVCAAAALAQGRFASLPEGKVPDALGVNIHFTGDRAELDRIAEAGFRFVRMDLTWEAVERKKGCYEFAGAGYDGLTRGCLRRGLRLLYILDYSNPLYEAGRSVRTDQGRRAFAAFAEAAARRYAGRGILWEIWNEPNLETFWQPQPALEDYLRLVKAAAPLIRAADQSAQVVAPAASGIPFDWLEACFEGGLLNHVDAVSVHPYRADPPESVVGDYARLRELIAKRAPEGKQVPIICGEWGYSLVNWDGSRLSPAEQGHRLAREFLVNLWQRIPVSIWYDWRDDGPDPSEREHNFGTVARDLTPKPAYRAARALSHVLDGLTAGDRLNVGGEGDFAIDFRAESGRVIAVWTVGEPHRLALGLPAGRGTLVCAFGASDRIEWEEGGPELPVTSGPQYLVVDARGSGTPEQ